MISKVLGAAATLSVFFSLFSLAPAAAQSATGAAPVLVVGGTPAGVAAAVAAARHGADVALVAARPELGGVLTDAMMDQWDLNVAPAGEGVVQGGLFDEIHAALGDAFSPQQAADAFASLVAGEPRIHLIRDARVIAVSAQPTPAGRRVSAVTFRRPDGSTFTLDATTVVDATDDGDVAALAGARFDLGRQDTGIDERMQAVTLMFTLRGVDWAQVVDGYDVARDGAGGAVERRAWGYAALLARYVPRSPEVVVRDLNLGHESDGEVTVNAIDVLGVDALSDADLARARALSEREAPRLIAWLRTRIPGFADAQLGRFADALYVRETRHFAGVERLTADDVWGGTIPTDTIGLSSYPLDLHPVDARDKLAYAPERHVYGIPFGTLVPRDLANVLLASPAISATHIAAGSARVIPTTIEEGEAAGDAAALALREHLAFAAMARDAGDVAALRDMLRRGGTILSYRGSSGATRE
ncbi:MAG TPA: FAD-dependent oxidoreductase [Candidatus Sulfotelmatobacter sp.]|nr:FAD-dependent oxidoreductase [Candidatus Sulfotelmatobacter sp.]